MIHPHTVVVAPLSLHGFKTAKTEDTKNNFKNGNIKLQTGKSQDHWNGCILYGGS